MCKIEIWVKIGHRELITGKGGQGVRVNLTINFITWITIGNFQFSLSLLQPLHDPNCPEFAYQPRGFRYQPGCAGQSRLTSRHWLQQFRLYKFLGPFCPLYFAAHKDGQDLQNLGRNLVVGEKMYLWQSVKQSDRHPNFVEMVPFIGRALLLRKFR